ncbi:PREDICTED: ELMO domain-containing protein A isoform X1 [Camelina sativa]|uniref:ELMO domain-containing protein A isoform X1 n=2 Tax=Camelina sativa TaxID=90675 RepID=A0ABM0VJZ6_CAMSA|nr:PREDICTED: ELMO domain-containing protein A isoform X1 [Camelina sativa]
MKFRKRRQFFPSCSSHHQVEDDEAWERREKGNKEPRWQWSSSSAHVIAQLANYLFYEPVVVATGMVGTRSWIGGLFTRSNRRQDKSSVDYTLSPLQEERLQRLQDRMVVPFDETRTDHQESLKSLWNVAYPNVSLTGLVTEQWKEMGWQGPNPSTDFRGCGFIALENLLFSARTYPACFRRLLFKQRGDRAKWEYPFAVAGINISFMLIQMLDLQNNAKPKCLPGMNFLKLLEEDEKAFDVLYCIAFAMMDAQWLAMHASYMEFNEVLQATRNQLERELSLDDIHRIQDLPAYNLLFQ